MSDGDKKPALVVPHARARIADSARAREFDGDLVIIDLAAGEYFALDSVGARLWHGLAEGRTPEDVAGEIASAYDVGLEQALRDLVELTGELAARGLIVIDERGHGDD